LPLTTRHDLQHTIRRALEDAGIEFQKTGKNIGVSINVRKLPK